LIRPKIVIAIAFLFYSFIGQAQKHSNLVYMDKQGVLRYAKTNSEASFYGVNYTTPFAHAYRAQKALGLDLEEAIRNDVYHFARLGFDAFRVHVWDTEISDTAGNLLENDHLRLYDYLLAELKKRKIKTIITPIAFWGNGYPDRDEATPGFSRYFGRGKLTTNDTAIRAQENYMRQFFKHVNPYTKLSYEDDKDIIAVELNNEPAHSNPKKGVTDYINRLGAAVKSTGWTKPIFYNIAQGPYFSDAVAASNVDGFSFQWYPSGLVGNQTLKGNVLPNVDVYRIPFRDTVPAFKNRALMVYEFDAADVFDSYVYPAMARSFRGAGFQWATQFAYDPMAIANVNTEYQTHYLNLAYTPSKAISMLIASEVFHRIPRMKSYGTYPVDSVFDVFRVSYANKLSEMNSPEKFYYSNNTSTIPVNKKQLKNIAGVGSSSIVSYSGTGAYFIDKIKEGVWRLEVMPDVIYIHDPFERTSPEKIVTTIAWKSNKIEIRIDELGNNFSVKPLNKNNNYSATATDNSFQITPGAYLISKRGLSYSGNKNSLAPIGFNEFVAPIGDSDESVHGRNLIKGTILANGSDLELYNPTRDRTVYVVPNFRRGFRAAFVPAADTTQRVHRFSISDMSGNEVMGLQHFVGAKINERNSLDLSWFEKIIVRAKSDSPLLVLRIALVDKHGQAFSSTVWVIDKMEEVELPLKKLQPDSSLLMPRPYPGFQPLYFRPAISNPVLNLNEIEKLEITVNPGLQVLKNRTIGFEIESVRLAGKNN